MSYMFRLYRLSSYFSEVLLDAIATADDLPLTDMVKMSDMSEMAKHVLYTL
jgi:hypothetical protein